MRKNDIKKIADLLYNCKTLDSLYGTYDEYERAAEYLAAHGVTVEGNMRWAYTNSPTPYVCPVCGEGRTYKSNFCPECGERLVW